MKGDEFHLFLFQKNRSVCFVLGLPFIAGLVALRKEQGLSRVEQASQALAVGDLSARVASPHSPPEDLAASFNAMADRVEHLIRSRDELVQAVSHELGSPLSRLRFQVELLGNNQDASRTDRIEAINRELDALDELVAELLSYVQSDELQLDRQLFNPEKGLSDLAELARLEASEEHPVRLELQVEKNLEVYADQRLFFRAVENLLRNAVRHSESSVSIEATQEGQQIQVAINDDGPGIPNDMREQVVQPFIRLGGDRDRKSGGVGLGLAIVSRILERHGGSLRIETSSMGGAGIVTEWPIDLGG